MQISEIARELKTQDNRCTDQPMFIVQEEVTTGPFIDGYGDFYEWFNSEEIEYASEHLEMRLEQRIEAGAYSEDSYKGWRRYHMKKEWQFVTACFTEKGCEEYLKRNGHNHRGRTRIYAIGSVRNVEYQAVRDFLLREELTKSE